MNFPINIKYTINHLFNNQEQTLTLQNALTIFVGANGSGKTQVMRSLKNNSSLKQICSKKQIKYLSPGRLAFLESYRSNIQGNHIPNHDEAKFGGQNIAQYRHESESGFGSFHTLAQRIDVQIKVQARLEAFFQRKLLINWDQGNLTIKLGRGNSSAYSSAREANGLIHLIIILATLYDDDIGVLLLDEPEVSLHPQLQSFLLREIQKVANDPKNNKIIIMATHSTTMIDLRKTEDLTSIVFFSDPDTPPHQILKDAGELKNKKIKEFISHINATHKEAFFCKFPLLVEGQSDYIICNNLERHLDLYLDISGTQIIPVMGKNSIPIVVKLMKLIGKNPIILADLDAWTDDNSLINVLNTDNEIREKVTKQGSESLCQLDNDIRNKLVKIINNNWENIKLKAEQHTYWKNRHTDKDEDEMVAKKRSTVAILMEANDSEIESWEHSQDWIEIKNRITALFNFLEKVGCFFLRKGTIENYYKFADQNTSSGKPNAALEEVEELITQDDSCIEEDYADIIRALKYAANPPKVDEVSVLSELLLAIVSPVLGEIDKNTTDSQLKTISENILRERASLFKLSNETNNDSEPILNVEINTDILEVSGFPLKLPKTSNPINEVKKNIKQK